MLGVLLDGAAGRGALEVAARVERPLDELLPVLAPAEAVGELVVLGEDVDAVLDDGGDGRRGGEEAVGAAPLGENLRAWGVRLGFAEARMGAGRGGNKGRRGGAPRS